MLFNTHEFIFAFLPATLVVFFLLGRLSRSWALSWIIVASLCFYAWWRPLNVFIMGPAVLTNFLCARGIQRSAQRGRPRLSKACLIAGIAFNLSFLGYFKYANFGARVVDDVFGKQLVLTEIILPLGISFITFQVITFLIDVHGRRIESFTLHDFCLFVLFFPQLIAGPIVHYREMMPQFHRLACVADRENLSVGITLFAFGLFKKVFLADGIAPPVSAIFDQAAAGATISFIAAWMAAVGFTFQIYFDFSGYTDMALGIGRCIGVRLPQNFNSPLRASNIIDFWLRWHITLTRFLTAYIYNPLALSLTRRRMAKGRPIFGGRKTSVGAYLELLVFPTLLTMFLSGLWHGAGYLFILWGLLHGVYLAVNHAWRQVGPRFWRDAESYKRVMRPVGFGLTFVGVAFSMILFRSPTVAAAGSLLKGMLGLSGVSLPSSIYHHLGPLTAVLQNAGIGEGLGEGVDFGALVRWLPPLAVIALACPNTQEILARYEPALGVKAPPERGALGWRSISWNASLAWAALLSAIAAIGILHLGGQSEFLYWQF